MQTKFSSERFANCTKFAAALERRKDIPVSRFSGKTADWILLAMLLILFAGIGIGFAVCRYYQGEQQARQKQLADEGARREAEGKRIAREMIRKAAEEKQLADENIRRKAEEKRIAENKAAEEKRRAELIARKAAQVRRSEEEAASKAADKKRQLENRKIAESLYLKGRECYSRKDYVHTAEYYRKAADQGNSAAQN